MSKISTSSVPWSLDGQWMTRRNDFFRTPARLCYSSVRSININFFVKRLRIYKMYQKGDVYSRELFALFVRFALRVQWLAASIQGKAVYQITITWLSVYMMTGTSLFIRRILWSMKLTTFTRHTFVWSWMLWSALLVNCLCTLCLGSQTCFVGRRSASLLELRCQYSVSLKSMILLKLVLFIV